MGGWVGFLLMKIYLVGKNIYITALTDEAIKNVVLSFMVFDDNKVPQNYVFEQTESLTQNLMGITEYGMLTFNSNNSDMEADVTIRARLNDDVVEKTLKVSEIMETAEGREIGTGGGGGTVYKAGWGINIVDDEISADRSVVASTEYVDNGLLVLKGEIETELADKQDKPENGFVAHYQTTTAQEIIEYLDRVGDNNSQVVIERGNDFYGCVLVSKQGDNKVVLRSLGSNMGKYYIYTYTITNGVWASNSYGLQELLNSGVNIKTLNGESLLGNGDISLPKNTYKFDETIIGSYIDENGIENILYRKVVDIGNLPNTASKTVAHGLAGVVKEFLSIRGVAKSSNNSLPLPSCAVDPTGENNIYIGVGPNNITITTGKDRSTFTGKVTLEYIKNE